MRNIAHGLRDFHAQSLHKELQEYQSGAPPAELSPPSYNMGGTSPTPRQDIDNQKVVLDWLGFSSPASYRDLVTGDKDNHWSFLRCLFPDVVIQRNNRGTTGFPESDTLYLDGVNIGEVGYGATHGKILINIRGSGCQHFRNGDYPFIFECLQAVSAKLTRVDHALDFFKGELTYDQVKEAYFAGEFKLPKSPVDPIYSEVGKGRVKDNLGRTFYVGSRKTSKMFRGYEKGLQIFSNMSEDFRQLNTDPEMLTWGEQEGAKQPTIATQWFRAEVENKSKDCVLSLDMITRRDEYFAGAYPFTARLLDMASGVRPERLQATVDIELTRSIKNARNSCGNLVYSLTKLGFTSDEIVQMLSTGKHSDKLVKSGILARMQADPTLAQDVRMDLFVPF